MLENSILRKVLLGAANSPLSTSRSEGWVAKGVGAYLSLPINN